MPANAVTVTAVWENIPAVTPPPADDKPTKPATEPPVVVPDTPAITTVDLNKVKVQTIDMVWTGKQIRSGFAISVTYNVNGKAVTKTLYPNRDYSFAGFGKNKNIGKGSVTIVGKAGYTGKVTVSFKIVPRTPTKLKVKSGKRSLKVTFAKVSKAQKVKTYKVQYRYKNGNKWTSWKSKTVKVKAKSKAKTVTVTLKKLKSKKTYQVQVYAYRGAYKSPPTGPKPAKVKR
jgi:hypothetical protein